MLPPVHYDSSLDSASAHRPILARRPKNSQAFLLVVAFGLSLVSLIWVLHDFEWDTLVEEIRDIHWGWIGAAVFFDILVYFLQGWRWSLLLRPVARIPFSRSIRAIYVGLFANEILPLRSGELIRCYLQGRWSHLPFTVTLSSALIERIFDGIWLLVCLGVTTHYIAVPRKYLAAGEVLGFLIAVAAALLVGAMYVREPTERFLNRYKHTQQIVVLLDDLYIIGRSRYLVLSAFASLPYLLLQVLPIYAVAEAYGMEVSLGQGFALMVILRLVSVVPQAPGNLGTFQAAAAFGLMLFGFDEGLAKRFSFVLWGVITLPLLIAGFIALAITGLNLRELRDDAKSAAK